MAESIPSTIGRYQVRGVVATGGMGVVLAAHDPELGRQVAIKLLAREHEEARTRLVREAQAMARLQHANVVTVHEILKLDDRAAIVMELVDGSDLATWLAEAPRSWREIVDAFVQAGRGLAAAHKAGLVHRDFKPSNALIDRDNAVRVTDFGLVCATAASAELIDGHDAATDQLDMTLTRTGTLLGTPAYMAPEQYEGGTVDARSDQWALACALYGALHRQRPFAGDSVAELSASVRAGHIRPEPATTRVPRPIRAAIRRALALDPDDRFATVDDFLVALTPSRRRWVVAAAIAGVAVAAVAIAVVVWTRDRADRAATCDGLDAQFAATWNADRANEIRTRFGATGISFAADAADRVVAALDRYRDGWVAMRTRTCTDGRRRTSTPDLADRRAHCLDLRLAEVDAVVGALVAADAELVSTASGAVARLPLVGDCADPVDTVPRPGDPAARAAIARAEADVARARSLIDLGKLSTARELAERAIAVSEQTRWTPLAVEALIEVGKTQSRLREVDAALVTFDRAAHAAAEASDDARLAEALIQRFYVLSSVDRTDEALAGKQYIEVVVERAGGSPFLRGMWLSMLATALQHQGRHQEALDTQLEATALMRQAVDPGNLILSDCLNNEATFRMSLGQLDEAKAILERLLVTDAATHGPGHPELARRHYNLGNIAWGRGQLEDGLAHFEKAYAIRKAAGTVEWVAPFGLADKYEDVGRLSAARPLFVESVEILERTQKGSPWVMYGHVSLGILDFQLGNLDESRVWFEKGRAAPQAPTWPGRHEIPAYFALIALATGDVRDAKRFIAESYVVAKPIPNASFGPLYLAEAEVALIERECARVDKFLAPFKGKPQPLRWLGTAVTIIGAECQLAKGTPAVKQAARDALDARLAEVEQDAPDPGATARLRFALARALVATDGDRDRARSLAEGARDGYATLGNSGRRRAAEVARWLEAHR